MRRVGGLAIYVNQRSCNPGHISVKEQCCTKNIKLLAVSAQSYHLAWEFSHVIVLTFYVPPLPNAMAVCEDILSTFSQLHLIHSLSPLSPGNSTMPHSLPLFPTSPMLTAIQGTVKHWTCCLPTQKRLTAHHPFPRLASQTTTWFILPHLHPPGTPPPKKVIKPLSD